MDFRLPIPKNWQDFESICHRLWMEIWNDPNAQKNGRQGQSQNGVDIFGTPIYSKTFGGVQCKDKDKKLGSHLKEKELIAECNKAKNFFPEIKSFSMATTSSRDENIQLSARDLTINKNYPFSVQVWSWDDIESEIAYRPSILNRYYPDFVIPSDEQSSILLNRYSSREHLYAFFTRPFINNTLSNQVKEYIRPLAYELSDNAYLHGKASYFKIQIENNRIIFCDDGKKFNPLTELNSALTTSESHVGSYVFDSLKKKFDKKIRITYIRKKSSRKLENQIEFQLTKDLENVDENNLLQLTIDLHQAYGRNAAKNLANTIPIDIVSKEIVLTVNEVYNISAFVEFINASLKRLSEKQKLTISIPRISILKDMVTWFDDERLNIQMR